MYIVQSQRVEAGSLKMNTALEYSTRVVQEEGRRCQKSTLNDLVHLTPLRIPLINPLYGRGGQYGSYLSLIFLGSWWEGRRNPPPLKSWAGKILSSLNAREKVALMMKILSVSDLKHVQSWLRHSPFDGIFLSEIAW
jgi:hypothetical protein